MCSKWSTGDQNGAQHLWYSGDWCVWVCSSVCVCFGGMDEGWGREPTVSSRLGNHPTLEEEKGKAEKTHWGHLETTDALGTKSPTEQLRYTPYSPWNRLYPQFCSKNERKEGPEGEDRGQSATSLSFNYPRPLLSTQWMLEKPYRYFEQQSVIPQNLNASHMPRPVLGWG